MTRSSPRPARGPAQPVARGRALAPLILACGLSLGALSLAAKADVPHAAAPAMAGPTIRIDNFTFSPAVITVARGATVTWVNGDDIPHTATATDKSFRSKVLDTDDRFSFTFTKAGEYGYFCSIHPHMTGKVIVR